MGVLLEGGTGQGVQASYLIFLPALLVDAPTLAWGSSLDAAAVDGHGHGLWKWALWFLAAVVQPILGALVPGTSEFFTDLFGQGGDVTGADTDAGQAVQHLFSQAIGLELAAGLDDLQADSRAVGVAVKFQQGTLREKNPAGRRGSNQRVPGGGTGHPGR